MSAAERLRISSLRLSSPCSSSISRLDIICLDLKKKIGYLKLPVEHSTRMLRHKVYTVLVVLRCGEAYKKATGIEKNRFLLTFKGFRYCYGLWRCQFSYIHFQMSKLAFFSQKKMRNTDLIRASWKLKDPIGPDPQLGHTDYSLGNFILCHGGFLVSFRKVIRIYQNTKYKREDSTWNVIQRRWK